MRDYEAILAEMEAKEQEERLVYQGMSEDQLISIILNFKKSLAEVQKELKELKGI
jgi:hypothetical protein